MNKLSEVWVLPRLPTPKNPYLIIVAMVLYPESWDRVLKHKGVTHVCNRIERPMTLSEIEVEENSWRMHYYKYQKWQGLLEDEWLVTADRQWLEKIKSFSGLFLKDPI